MKNLPNIIPIEHVDCPEGRGRNAREGRTSINVALIFLFLTAFAGAQTLTGFVKNSTTGKPSVGDEVTVFSLGQGMGESGRTKTDAMGKFSFKLDDARTPHLDLADGLPVLRKLDSVVAHDPELDPAKHPS